MPDPLFPLSAPQNPSQQPGQQKQEIGEVVYNVEFNDSVLSTKTWNNPRYDGCETKTQTLNKFTQGDISYGKKTAVQKYTRNIYVGEFIYKCSGSGFNEITDLVPFPNFSYASTTKYITVNDDDTIDEIKYSNNVIDEKIGFYRSFQEDFAVGSDCRILLLNEGIVNSLEDKYGIYFNEGLLKQVATYQNSGLPGIGFDTFRNFYPLYNQTSGTDSSGNIFGTFNIKNSPETRQTYSGSVGVSLTGDISASVLEFLDSINDKLINTDFRYFSTAKEGDNGEIHEITPIYSRINNGGIKTVELMAYKRNLGNPDEPAFKYSSKYTLENIGNIAGNQDSGSSYEISKLNDSIPSVLINLNKDDVLPNGLIPGQYVPNPFGGEIIFQQDFAQRVGPKFVIIPENLHPYIKENLNYFLIKAGLMEENNKLTINPKNRQLS